MQFGDLILAVHREISEDELGNERAIGIHQIRMKTDSKRTEKTVMKSIVFCFLIRNRRPMECVGEDFNFYARISEHHK